MILNLFISTGKSTDLINSTFQVTVRFFPPTFGSDDVVNTASFMRQVTLADQQADPNSPLYSAKTFEELGLCVVP